jgi:hypothetical protein
MRTLVADLLLAEVVLAGWSRWAFAGAVLAFLALDPRVTAGAAVEFAGALCVVPALDRGARAGRRPGAARQAGVLAAAARKITVRGIQRRDFEPLAVILRSLAGSLRVSLPRRVVSPADIARVSPLAHAHVIPSGTYDFERVAVTGRMRPHPYRKFPRGCSQDPQLPCG